MKNSKTYNFYLCETDTDESTGYRVKQLDGKGELVSESFIPIEELEWFRDKSYKLIRKVDFEKIGIDKGYKEMK